MRGKTLLTILEILSDVAVGSIELVGGILEAGYGASPGKIEYIIAQRRRERSRHSSSLGKERRTRQKYYNMISYLKRNGCIEEKKTQKRKILLLKRRGLEKLATLKKQYKQLLPRTNYPRASADTYVIVVFDIPEKEKRKRAWLRSVLRNMGLRLIQKSVWIGKIKLPREFVDDLRRLNMLEHIEIFRADKLNGFE